MTKQALLIVGVWTALSAACGSKTLGTAPDGAADVPQGTGGTLGADAPMGSGGSPTSGSGGVIGQGGSGPMGSGGLATGSGGAGGRAGSGGSGGQSLDAITSAEAGLIDVGSSRDGATAGDAAIDVVAPNCTAGGGSCTQLVNGCATCPSGNAPAASRYDCPGQWWCCSPLPSVTDECWRNGGMCIPGLGSTCPPGWTDDWTSCRNATSKCCMPKPEVCGTVPRDLH